MKKFTKLLCTLALLFGAVGVASSVKAAQRVWSPSSPWSDFANCKWTAATETFSWNGTHDVVRAIQTGFGGDLSDYENFYITVSEFVGDGVNKLSIKVNCDGGTEKIIDLTEGENVLAIADMFANPANVTTFELWGPSSSSTECSAKVTNVYLEGPDPVLPTTTWTASEVGAGNYYLYNVGKGQFLTRGNGWGTQASTGFNAMTLTVEEYDGAYKLRTNMNGDGKGLERLGDPVIYTDQSDGKNATWTFTKVDDAANGPVYTIVSKDNHGGGAGSYMTASADNTIVGPADAVTDDYGRWQLVQAWVTNTMPVINADGWTVSQTPTFDSGNINAEFWNKGGASIKQTISNLPAGKYDLIAVALTREGYVATLNAGINTMSIATVGNGTVNNRTQAKDWFNAGNGVNTLEFTHAGGNLEIGLTADNANGDHWLVWRSFILLYKGLDLSELKAALQDQIDAVPALEGTIPTAAYNAVKSYADGINVDALTTEEAISTASSELSSRVDAAKALQANYARYLSVKAEVLAIDDDATVYTGSATVDVSAADAAVAAATTEAEINAAIDLLRTAAGNFITSVTVNENKYFDVTNIWVVNPTVSQNVDGWNVENVVRHFGWSTGPTTNLGETEFYQSGFDINQSVTLPAGTWEFGVTGFHRAGTYDTYFYAGEDRILLPGETSDVVNSMAEAKTYFDNGNGKVALKFLLESESNTIKIGIINNDDNSTDKWTIFRNFTLKFYGAPDYSVYAQQWDDAVTAANEALDAQAYKYVSGNERTAVTTAIADAPDGSSKANYLEKIQALEAATAAFKAAAPSYNAWVLAKTECKNLWGSALGVADPTTAAEAAAGVNALNVAQYNKVASDYTFSATGLIGDFGSWTGTATVAGEPADPNYLDYEHWSGVTHAYYEQAANGWGNANGWTIQYEKKSILPAGDYVIKVAARSSAGTTSLVSCSATDKTVKLPNVGAGSRGINKAGEASWEDGEFVNNGNGFGWQWRFLPFTLAEETEVTMTFYAEATSQYQWMSIADGELLSTTKLAEDVAYNETANNTITNTIIADVTMTRTIKEGFNTVCLPFTLTTNQVAAAFGAGTKVYAFSEADGTDPENVTINFTQGDGSITANVPVLVNATADSEEQVFNGVQIVAANAEDVKVDGYYFNFVGVYAPTTVEKDDWFIGNGALYESKGDTNIKAFRAYLDLQNPVQSVKMFIDGITTDIREINGMAEVNDGAIYTVSGQRVQKAQKGLYIVNGKKVVVK